MNLVSCEWLYQNLKNENLCILDCSWHLPGTNRNGKEEFDKLRIPGAIFFDIDYFSDEKSLYPHTLLNKDIFSKKVSEIGIKNSDHIICYDSLGIFSSARVCWMFKQYGHEKVSVLNGGLKNWKLNNFDTDSESPKAIQSSKYFANQEPKNVKYYNDIKNNISKTEFQLIDARPAGRFNGTDPEPRPELKSGHIEGSKNIPFNSLINTETGCLKSKEELKKIFEKEQIVSDQDITFSCGSGVAATIAGMAFNQVFDKEFDIYDGSWTEWALKNKLLK